MSASRNAAGFAFGIVLLGGLEVQAAPATTNPIPAPVVAPDNQTTYRCILAPQPGECDAVYRKALHDTSPEAGSIRDAYEHYARYLTGANALTDADTQYLKTNQIPLPDDLSPAQTSGLHNVINDPTQKGTEDRKEAVVNFLSRAEEANVYCGMEGCKGSNQS
jgi:hypothetical protein